MRRPSTLIAFLHALLLGGLIFAVHALPAGARDVDSGEQNPSAVDSTLKVGLVLSGGGAKGFAHIGVLKVLHEHGIPVHVVTGSSMGAMVGGLYAAGYEPARIEEIALDLDWQAFFDDRYKRSSGDLGTYISSRDTWLISFPLEGYRPQLPSGLIDGQNLSLQLYRWTLPWHDTRDFSRLPVSFAAVATDLATGEARTLDSGYLPEAIRASAAIPSIFKPVSYEGRLYIDGGVSRNIPAEDARRLGADLLLVSDVGEPVKPVDSLRTFVDILFQAVGFHQAESDSAQLALADLRIRPDIEAFNSFSYERTAELIRRGEEATRRMLPRIRELLTKGSIAAAPRFPDREILAGDSLRITGLRLEGMDARLARQAEAVVRLSPPETVKYAEIEREVNRLYATDLFSLVTYRLSPDSTTAGGYLLELSVQRNEPDRAVFSLRYDSPYKAALLFGTRLRNRLAWGDQLSAELRLGEILGLAVRYDLPLALRPNLKYHTDLEVFRSPVDIYGGEQRLSTVEVERLALHPSLSMRLADRWRIQAGIRSEFYNLNEEVGNILLLEDSRFLLNGTLRVDLENLDRAYFPGRGQQATLALTGGSRSMGSEMSFAQVLGGWRGALPVFRGFSLQARLTGGHTLNGAPPLHYLFYPGGLSPNPRFPLRQIPLHGYANQQLSGSQMVAAGASLQWETGKELFLQAGWNAARVSAEWDWSLKAGDFRHGYFLGFGAQTLLGPASVVLSSPDLRGGYALALSVGYTF